MELNGTTPNKVDRTQKGDLTYTTRGDADSMTGRRRSRRLTSLCRHNSAREGQHSDKLWICLYVYLLKALEQINRFTPNLARICHEISKRIHIDQSSEISRRGGYWTKAVNAKICPVFESRWRYFL